MVSLFGPRYGRYDTQHSDILHNSITTFGIITIKCNIQYNDTMLSVIMLRVLMLNVVKLSVVAP